MSRVEWKADDMTVDQIGVCIWSDVHAERLLCSPWTQDFYVYMGQSYSCRNCIYSAIVYIRQKEQELVREKWDYVR